MNVDTKEHRYDLCDLNYLSEFLRDLNERTTAVFSPELCSRLKRLEVCDREYA